MKNILKTIIDRSQRGEKMLGVLIDPDKVSDASQLTYLINLANENCVDYFLLGGSLVTTSTQGDIIQAIKRNTSIPVILFPGSAIQIDAQADGILFLSLISGRNPELLIGQHVLSAPILKNTQLEIIPTGYMLINSGKTTSVAYISNTTPIPDDKFSLAACTALAGEMLGLKIMYMDAGSGAEKPINQKMISTVKKAVRTPLIIGGGIDSPQKAMDAFNAGADMIVIGNALEKSPDLLTSIAEKIYENNKRASV